MYKKTLTTFLILLAFMLITTSAYAQDEPPPESPPPEEPPSEPPPESPPPEEPPSEPPPESPPPETPPSEPPPEEPPQDFQNPYCGDGSCDIGEDPNNCESDCGAPPLSNIPPGCHEETDEQGFVHVVCETPVTCPQIPQEVFDRCRNEGGNPVTVTDGRGCEFVDCRFQEGGDFFELSQCTSPQQIKDDLQKCANLRMRGNVVREGGCEVVRCFQEEERSCRETMPEERRSLEEQCRGVVIDDFDSHGCGILRCTDRGYCSHDVPQEAYFRCKEDGGEFVVKHNEEGCISFKECVRRGDDRDIFIEDIDKLPDVGQLLEIALKLDSLIIKFQEISKKLNDIADFFAERGSPNEERYRRAADMMENAEDEIDSIKFELRERLDDVGINDLRDFKFKVKEIKERILKDVLYIILSSNADEEFEESDSDCGYDSACFDRAFRICKPITFRPEREVFVKLVGLEDDKCVMEAEMNEGPQNFAGGPPFTMTCRIPDYADGMSEGPEKILPFCEGSMVEIIKKFGGEEGNERGGPGGCRSEYECEKFCRKNPDVCMQWCLNNPDICPQEHLREAERFRERGSGEGSGEQFGEEFREEEFGSERTIERERFGEFEGTFNEEQLEKCGGCLDNNICDPGECSYCGDCK